MKNLVDLEICIQEIEEGGGRDVEMESDLIFFEKIQQKALDSIRFYAEGGLNGLKYFLELIEALELYSVEGGQELISLLEAKAVKEEGLKSSQPIDSSRNVLNYLLQGGIGGYKLRTSIELAQQQGIDLKAVAGVKEKLSADLYKVCWKGDARLVQQLGIDLKELEGLRSAIKKQVIGLFKLETVDAVMLSEIEGTFEISRAINLDLGSVPGLLFLMKKKLEEPYIPGWFEKKLVELLAEYDFLCMGQRELEAVVLCYPNLFLSLAIRERLFKKRSYLELLSQVEEADRSEIRSVLGNKEARMDSVVDSMKKQVKQNSEKAIV